MVIIKIAVFEVGNLLLVVEVKLKKLNHPSVHCIKCVASIKKIESPYYAPEKVFEIWGLTCFETMHFIKMAIIANIV